MTTQQSPGNNDPAPMINAFPQPGNLIRLAYRELHIAVNGTPEQQQELGNHARLPRPWEPATCGDPELRQQLWQWLDAVVIWLNRDYTWDAQEGVRIPACWPHHPHVVHEIAVLADQRRRAGLAKTSDALEEWHRYCLPSFVNRMQLRLRSHCDDGHAPWPGRPQHNEHTSQALTQRRDDAFAADVNALPERQARGSEAKGPRLGVVDLVTGELHTPPMSTFRAPAPRKDHAPDANEPRNPP